jgi:type IX secretion system PorP/SprF family membrane protein
MSMPLKNSMVQMQKTKHLMGPLCLCLLLALPARGQQDPMFTQFIFNSLVFNPACAGMNGHLTLNLNHRRQWAGLDGAPVTQALSGHMAVSGGRIGLGLSMVRDKVGPTGTFDLNTAYAYRLPVGDNMQLSAGLQASVSNWRGDWFDVVLEDAFDGAFQRNQSRWLPNFGAGVFLQGKRFYAGLSCPRLVEHDLRQASGDEYPFYARSYRHYYLMAGLAYPLDPEERIVLQPNFLLKSAGVLSGLRRNDTFNDVGAPTELDLDCSIFFNRVLRLGAAWRTALEMRSSSAASANAWAEYYLKNGLRLGLAYDHTLSKLRTAAPHSVELLLGYEFDVKVKKVSSVRYF